jgi:hypothetical protein
MIVDASHCIKQRQSNNSFNPTRLSVAFINLVALRLACVISSAVGLIRALVCFVLHYYDLIEYVTTMNEAAKIAERIEHLLPHIKAGTLRFFGEWFGRPYDNMHVIKSAEVKDDCLIVTFDQNEVLSIWNQSGFKINEKEFQIDSASRVIWQWYYYWRPQTSENLYYFDYLFEGNELMAKTNVDFYEAQLQPNQNESAVKIY